MAERDVGVEQPASIVRRSRVTNALLAGNLVGLPSQRFVGEGLEQLHVNLALRLDVGEHHSTATVHAVVGRDLGTDEDGAGSAHLHSLLSDRFAGRVATTTIGP